MKLIEKLIRHEHLLSQIGLFSDISFFCIAGAHCKRSQFTDQQQNIRLFGNFNALWQNVCDKIGLGLANSPSTGR